MRKAEKAIKTLERHDIELNSVSDALQGNTWKAALKDTIDRYIGPESSISRRLDRLYFTRKETSFSSGPIIMGPLIMHVYEDSRKENFRDLIKKAISHIHAHGVYKRSSGPNFLGGFTNAQIIGGLVIAVPLLVSCSVYLGRFEREREIIDLQKVIESKDQEIKGLVEEETAELKALKVENKNVWDTYHKLNDEHEQLKAKFEKLSLSEGK